MVDAGLWEIGVLEDMGFEDIKISLKAFDVPTMVAAYREMATRPMVKDRWQNPGTKWVLMVKQQP